MEVRRAQFQAVSHHYLAALSLAIIGAIAMHSMGLPASVAVTLVAAVALGPAAKALHNVQDALARVASPERRDRD